jgi:transposase
MAWQPKKLNRKQMEERRLEGMQLLQSGEMTQAEISRQLGVSEVAVSQWKKKLAADGAEGLERKKATGRPPKLDQQEKKALIEKLEKGGLAAGFPTEQWTQARGKKVLSESLGFVIIRITLAAYWLTWV